MVTPSHGHAVAWEGRAEADDPHAADGTQRRLLIRLIDACSIIRPS